MLSLWAFLPFTLGSQEVAACESAKMVFLQLLKVFHFTLHFAFENRDILKASKATCLICTILVSQVPLD